MVAAVPDAAQASLTCSLIAANTGSCTETVNLGSQTTNFTVAGTLDLFNPNSSAVISTIPAGEHYVSLTSVVIGGAGSITSSGSITNQASGSIAYTFSSGLSLSLFGLTGAPAGFPTRTFVSTTTSGQRIYDYSLTSSSALKTINGHLAKNATTSYSQSGVFNPTQYYASNLGSFIGNGTFTFDAVGTADNQTTTGGGNLTALIQTTGTPMVTLTYDYRVSTPEPASMAVIGTGIVGLGVLRRRRAR